MRESVASTGDASGTPVTGSSAIVVGKERKKFHSLKQVGSRQEPPTGLSPGNPKRSEGWPESAKPREG
jgi:hypothetical protein